MIIKAYAPAKINLGLEILNKRNDGYHNVDMVMQSIDLFDDIILKETNDKRISVKHNEMIDLNVQDDISYKCAKLFFDRLKIKTSGILIEINKRIPISAGLGGGSSDGAAVLKSLNELYGNPFNQSELMELGAEIGADIPFCIMGGTARAGGIGTVLRVIESNLKYFLVLVKPRVSISTKKAYSLFDKTSYLKFQNFDELEYYIKCSKLEAACNNLFNRFEELINKECIQEIKNELINYRAMGALMSGSGSTVYGIFENECLARRCFEKLKLRYDNVFICKPIDHGVEVVKLN